MRGEDIPTTNYEIQIYIVNVLGACPKWIHDPVNVTKTLVQSFQERAYQPQVISDFNALDTLIQNPPENVVLINTHGEAFPMSQRWEEDWRAYLRKLGTLAKDFGWTIVSLTGYPLFYCSGIDRETQCDTNGLTEFISIVNGRVQGAFWSPVDLTMEGGAAASELNVLIPSRQIWVSRCFVWQYPEPTKRFYAAGPFVGAGTIPIGKGFLVYNGMMSTDFGTNPTPESDEILAKLSFLFTLKTVKRVVRLGKPEYQMDVLNRIHDDISRELGSLVSKNVKREKEVQREVWKFLKLKYKDLDFRWEQFEFPYSCKSYKPDFTSRKANIAIDVKLCKKSEKAKKIVDEINADITAYKTAFSYLLFIVYDTDKHIEDTETFNTDFERYNAGVRVIVIK